MMNNDKIYEQSNTDNASVIPAVSNRRKMIGNISLLAGILAVTTGCWHFYTWYEAIAPYGTLISFVCLAVTFFAYVDVKDALRDPVFYMMAAADVVALLNLIIVGSRMGAILTVVDILLVLYLANKIEIPRKWMIVFVSYIGIFFFYWTIDVKGYFKGYNTNYGGLVLITGFVCAMIASEYLRRYLREHDRAGLAKFVYVWDIAVFAVGFNIISWYRARCALLGYLVFAVLWLIPAKVWKRKWLYGILCGCMTLGSIVFTLLYVLLGKLREVFTIQVFYKDILSGREAIWAELWGEFLKKPLTGIGSAYTMKLSWMEGMFEVHNGLLDLLIVHGIAVFVVACLMLVKRLWALRILASSSALGKITMAAVMAILAASFLENFFIVPPFSLILLILLSQGAKPEN